MNDISATRANSRSSDHAFTFTELLVVIVVIALLALMVLPVLAGTAERSKRAACQNNLRQLAIGMTLYAGNNGGRIISARTVAGTSVQNVLNLPDATAAGTVGLAVNSNSTAWTCPNRPGLPIFEPAFPQWVIGYQYFGGITTWRNPVGSFPSSSPTNLAHAGPHWVLAADAVIKVNNVWGAVETGRELVYQNMPPHHTSDSLFPEGGNQAFVDGSVQWIPFEQMYFLHSWSPSSRLAFFYQNPKDFTPSLRLALARWGLLQARP
ncbi:MAG: prepilin-type N-terminal cleavage/methylation domain-containing protein [Verrucomicrobia bacterium]|nr:prepilin-type N-terminal cleavage/methylation domain-containing protein [Verrucomicrobiota bacterium]